MLNCYKGTIRFGYSPVGNEAWAYEIDPDNSVCGGFFHDLAERIARGLSHAYHTQIKVEWIPTHRSLLVPFLEDGSVDALLDLSKYGFGIHNIKSSEYSLNYSVPVFTRSLAWARGKLGAEENIRRWQDLNRVGVKIGLGSDNTANSLALWAHIRIPDAEIIRYDDLIDAAYAAHTGKIHAILGDGPSIRIVGKLYPKVTYQSELAAFDTLHVAVRGDNQCDVQCSSPLRSVWRSFIYGCNRY